MDAKTQILRLHRYRAKLVRVIDGDTVELDIDVGFYITFRVKGRLAGIDAPERGTPGAAEATKALTEMLGSATYAPDGWLSVETTKDDKYGRWLVAFRSFDGLNSINSELIAKGLAKQWVK